MLGIAVNGAEKLRVSGLGNLSVSGGITLIGAMTHLPFGASAGSTSEQRFTELAANGASYVGFKAPDTLAGDVIWTLPVNNSNGVLTNTSGTLSWGGAGSGTVTTVGSCTTGDCFEANNAGTENSLYFEGTGADDANEVQLTTAANPASDVAVNLPVVATTLVGTGTTDTLTNKTLTAPRIGTSILDTGGNELFLLTATGSATNELTLANAANGGDPTVTVSGSSDADVGLNLKMKGTDPLIVSSTVANSDTLKLQPKASGAATLNGILTSADLTASDKTWTLPDATGTVVLGVEYITNASASDSNNKTVAATCSAGNQVIGGGCNTTSNTDLHLGASYPTGSNTAWTCDAREGDAIAGNWTVTAYAICARVN